MDTEKLQHAMSYPGSDIHSRDESSGPESPGKNWGAVCVTHLLSYRDR